MNLIKFDIIESYLLIFITAILSFFLFYPERSIKIGNSALSTRIFTNVVVGGDIIWPEIVTPGPAIPTPIAAPMPSIIPIPAPAPSITNGTTNFSTNFPATNSVVNTNN